MIHLNITTLANIGLKQGTSKRDSLTIARRVLRQLCEYRRAHLEAYRALRRLAAIRREHLPFTRHNVEALERQADGHRTMAASVRPVLVAYGGSLIHDRDGYMAALGFDTVCDLLNVNRVDRERARREGWRTLSELIAINDLENSAERRSTEWGAGSPLFQACHAAMVEFIRTTPEHLLPDPFAPGEVFGPKLPPELRIVGK